MSTLGLNQLSSSNEMILEQQSVRCCPRIKKEYLVKNLAMENIFSLVGNDRWYSLFLCCQKTEIRLLDGENEIVRFVNKTECCRKTIGVYLPPNNFIGKVKEKLNPFRTKLVVKNRNGVVFLRIRGPVHIANIISPISEYEVNIA